jgi:hypothetical protein
VTFPGTDNKHEPDHRAIELGRLLEAHAVEFLRFKNVHPKSTDGEARAAADALYIKDITILRHELGEPPCR